MRGFLKPKGSEQQWNNPSNAAGVCFAGRV